MGHKKQRRRTRALLRPVLRGLQAWRETPSGIPNHAGPRCRGLCQRRASERSTLRGHVTRMPALADEEASSARRPGVLLCGPRTRDGDLAAKGHGCPRETARRERAGVCRRLDSRGTERLGARPSVSKPGGDRRPMRTLDCVLRRKSVERQQSAPLRSARRHGNGLWRLLSEAWTAGPAGASPVKEARSSRHERRACHE